MRSLKIIWLISWKELRVLLRSRSTMLVIFLPGIVLYATFAAIFAGPAGRPFRAGLVDLDDSPGSHQLVEALRANNVKVTTTETGEPDGPPLTVESAKRLIRKQGKFRVALVIPKGFGEAPDTLSGDRHMGVELYFDETQKFESETMIGMLQMAAGRRLMETGANLFGRRASTQTTQSADGEKKPDWMLVHVNSIGVGDIGHGPIHAEHVFLAGLVPMFVLFSASNGARNLLAEMGSGSIRRLLAAPIWPAHVLLGTMAYGVILSLFQCYAMYFFAWLVFDVQIWQMTAGLFVLSLATCLATTGFGMLMGAYCRTAEQLDAIGTVIILAMSAVGGSMVPRWIMPEWMLPWGKLTINGWAYDGFIALVRNEGLRGILEESLVLTAIAIGCAILGSVLMSRRLRFEPGR